MDTLTELQKLQYYREEVKTEFNLLAMRSTILVTCQSFLIVPYGILHTAPDYSRVLIAAYLIAILGIFTSLIIIRPLTSAHLTINMWLKKQRTLVKSSPELKDLIIERDMIPGVEDNPDKDTIYARSLAFSIYGPWAFFVFWICAIAWSTLRVFVFRF